MQGFERGAETIDCCGPVREGQAERPDGGPGTERAEVEPATKLAVYYVWHPDDRVRPCLVVADGDPSNDTFDELFGDAVAYRGIGYVAVPPTRCPVNLDYEAAAWAEFGGYEGPWGRPCGVQCVDLSQNERLVAEVAACVFLWPEHAPAWVTGPPTAESVAAAIRRHPDDVADVFERFGISKAMGLWCLEEQFANEARKGR